MKKKLIFSESDLVRLVRKVINEQVVDSTNSLPHTRRNPLSPKNDPYLYAYEGGENFYVTQKNTPNMWKIVSDERVKNAIKDKHFFELGYKILMHEIMNESISVDTPEDLVKVQNYVKRKDNQ